MKSGLKSRFDRISNHTLNMVVILTDKHIFYNSYFLFKIKNKVNLIQIDKFLKLGDPVLL